MIHVLTARGIGEPLVGNMLDGLVARLPRDWERHEVVYPAEYGFVNGTSNPWAQDFASTKLAGVAALTALVAEILAVDPDARFVILGYSAGAQVAGDFVASRPGVPVAACALVADPSNPGTRKLYGVAGSRLVPYAIEVARPDDVICCCPDSSPIRVIARLTERMQLADISVWGRDVWVKLSDPKVRSQIEAELGPWWMPSAWGRYEKAAAEARRYLGVPAIGSRPAEISTHVQYAYAWPEVARQIQERVNR